MKALVEYFNRTLGTVTQNAKTGITYLQNNTTNLLDIRQFYKSVLFVASGKFYELLLKTFSDNNTVVDLDEKGIDKPYSESLNFNETLTIENTKSLLELSSISDSNIKGYSKNITESVTLLDVFSKDSPKIEQEQVNVTDDVNGALVDDDQVFNIIKPLYETNIVLDDLTKGYTKTFAESVGVLEVFSKTFPETVQDYVGITDEVNGASVDDDQIFSVAKSLVETNIVLELLSKGTSSNKTNLVGISSSGIAGLQNYGSDYFLEDYVGTSVTIS